MEEIRLKIESMEGRRFKVWKIESMKERSLKAWKK